MSNNPSSTAFVAPRGHEPSTSASVDDTAQTEPILAIRTGTVVRNKLLGNVVELLRFHLNLDDLKQVVTLDSLQELLHTKVGADRARVEELWNALPDEDITDIDLVEANHESSFALAKEPSTNTSAIPVITYGDLLDVEFPDFPETTAAQREALMDLCNDRSNATSEAYITPRDVAAVAGCDDMEDPLVRYYFVSGAKALPVALCRTITKSLMLHPRNYSLSESFLTSVITMSYRSIMFFPFLMILISLAVFFGTYDMAAVYTAQRDASRVLNTPDIDSLMDLSRFLREGLVPHVWGSDQPPSMTALRYLHQPSHPNDNYALTPLTVSLAQTAIRTPGEEVDVGPECVYFNALPPHMTDAPNSTTNCQEQWTVLLDLSLTKAAAASILSETKLPSHLSTRSQLVIKMATLHPVSNITIFHRAFYDIAPIGLVTQHPKTVTPIAKALAPAVLPTFILQLISCTVMLATLVLLFTNKSHTAPTYTAFVEILSTILIIFAFVKLNNAQNGIEDVLGGSGVYNHVCDWIANHTVPTGQDALLDGHQRLDKIEQVASWWHVGSTCFAFYVMTFGIMSIRFLSLLPAFDLVCGILREATVDCIAFLCLCLMYIIAFANIGMLLFPYKEHYGDFTQAFVYSLKYVFYSQNIGELLYGTPVTGMLYYYIYKLTVTFGVANLFAVVLLTPIGKIKEESDLDMETVRHASTATYLRGYSATKRFYLGQMWNNGLPLLTLLNLALPHTMLYWLKINKHFYVLHQQLGNDQVKWMQQSMKMKSAEERQEVVNAERKKTTAAVLTAATELAAMLPDTMWHSELVTALLKHSSQATTHSDSVLFCFALITGYTSKDALREGLVRRTIRKIDEFATRVEKLDALRATTSADVATNTAHVLPPAEGQPRLSRINSGLSLGGLLGRSVKMGTSQRSSIAPHGHLGSDAASLVSGDAGSLNNSCVPPALQSPPPPTTAAASISSRNNDQAVVALSHSHIEDRAMHSSYFERHLEAYWINAVVHIFTVLLSIVCFLLVFIPFLQDNTPIRDTFRFIERRAIKGETCATCPSWFEVKDRQQLLRYMDTTLGNSLLQNDTGFIDNPLLTLPFGIRVARYAAKKKKGCIVPCNMDAVDRNTTDDSSCLDFTAGSYTNDVPMPPSLAGRLVTSNDCPASWNAGHALRLDDLLRCDVDAYTAVEVKSREDLSVLLNPDGDYSLLRGNTRTLVITFEIVEKTAGTIEVMLVAEIARGFVTTSIFIQTDGGETPVETFHTLRVIMLGVQVGYEVLLWFFKTIMDKRYFHRTTTPSPPSLPLVTLCIWCFTMAIAPIHSQKVIIGSLSAFYTVISTSVEVIYPSCLFFSRKIATLFTAIKDAVWQLFSGLPYLAAFILAAAAAAFLLLGPWMESYAHFPNSVQEAAAGVFWTYNGVPAMELHSGGSGPLFYIIYGFMMYTIMLNMFFSLSANASAGANLVPPPRDHMNSVRLFDGHLSMQGAFVSCWLGFRMVLAKWHTSKHSSPDVELEATDLPRALMTSTGRICFPAECLLACMPARQFTNLAHAPRNASIVNQDDLPATNITAASRLPIASPFHPLCPANPQAITADAFINLLMTIRTEFSLRYPNEVERDRRLFEETSSHIAVATAAKCPLRIHDDEDKSPLIMKAKGSTPSVTSEFTGLGLPEDTSSVDGAGSHSGNASPQSQRTIRRKSQQSSVSASGANSKQVTTGKAENHDHADQVEVISIVDQPSSTSMRNPLTSPSDNVAQGLNSSIA